MKVVWTGCSGAGGDSGGAAERSSPGKEETTMTLNVGGAERTIRVVLGVVVLSLIVIGPQTWWGLLGLIPLGTGLWGW